MRVPLPAAGTMAKTRGLLVFGGAIAAYYRIAQSAAKANKLDP